MNFYDTTMTFHEACATVLRRCPNRYACAYAEAGLRLNGPEEQRVQALYILSNISHWRGKDATVVRVALKRHSKRS